MNRVLGKWPSARRRGDKFPRLYRHFDAMLTAFPTAKYIHVVRDPVAVAMSYERRRAEGTLWRKDWDHRQAVAEMNVALAQVKAHYDLLDILIVSYGEIVRREPAFVRKMWSFLDLPDHAPPSSRVRPAPNDAALLETVKRHVRGNLDHDLWRWAAAVRRRPGIGRNAFTHSGSTLRPPVDVYHAADAGRFAYARTTYDGRSRFLLRGDGTIPPRYGVAIGSAWTFGRFIETPFTALLTESLGIPVLNLGIGGARPETFLSDPFYMSLIEGAAFVTCEAMSARGYPSPVFSPNQAPHNVGLTPLAGVKKISGEYSFVDHVYQKARRVLDPAYMESVYTTMRRAYHRDLGKLFRAGAGKTVALYWGPARREDVWTYPHLISEESFRRLADVHGVPVAAVAGETPDYYAPAAMHREAAAALAGALGRLRGSAHDGSDALRAPGSG